MKIQTLTLENKPLSMVFKEDTVYIGDTYGKLLKIEKPYKTPIELSNLFFAPISAILLTENNIFYTDWSGTIVKLDKKGNFLKKKNFGKSMIKAAKLFDSKIYVSYECLVIILSLEFELIEEIAMPYKVLCFKSFEQKLYCGMNNPYICSIGESIQNTKHDSSIFTMSEYEGRLLTGSADKTIRLFGNEIIFNSDNWIRSIDAPIVGEGNNVWNLNTGKILYSHKMEVCCVIYEGELIFSIGYDHQFVVCNEKENETATLEEDEDIESFLRDFQNK